jgi:hypothetical protein
VTRVSASAVPRLLACPGSAHLRHADYESKHAEAGDERHLDKEIAADLGATDELPKQVRALLQPGDELATECAMAYDVSDDTARALGHINWRDYRDLRPFEIPMTLDLVIRGNGRLVYVDYKGFEEVDSAATNTQLATGALALARASGLDEVTVAIVYLGAEWRPADVAVLSAYDLDAHADRLRALMTSTDKTLRVNKHCKYCPGFHDCPEQKKLATEASGGALAIRVESMIPFADDEDAADGYEMWQRVKMLSARMSAALHARAAERPIRLRNGKMFGPVAKPGNEKLDGDVVWKVVGDQHGRDVADQAVVRTATKKRLTDTLKGKRGAALAVLKEVKARGGISQKPTTTIEEYEVGPRLVTDTEEPKQIEEAAHTSPF